MPGLQADEINREVIIFNLLCNLLQRAFILLGKAQHCQPCRQKHIVLSQSFC